MLLKSGLTNTITIDSRFYFDIDFRSKQLNATCFHTVFLPNFLPLPEVNFCRKCSLNFEPARLKHSGGSKTRNLNFKPETLNCHGRRAQHRNPLL